MIKQNHNGHLLFRHHSVATCFPKVAEFVSKRSHKHKAYGARGESNESSPMSKSTKTPDTNKRHYFEMTLRTGGLCSAARVKLESEAATELSAEPSRQDNTEWCHYFSLS